MIRLNENNQVIYSYSIRKIIIDLLNENNFSGNADKEFEIPRKPRNYKRKQRYLN